MKLILQITRGLVRDQHTRRMTMFVVVIAALAMLFSGATFLSGPLVARPWLFIVYWAACAWLTLAAVLLAIFDLLMLRGMAARERRKLRAEIFGKEHEDGES